MKNKLDLFKTFLNLHWLRPENALTLTLRSLSYQKSLKFFDEKSSLDVCCGDGSFSFVTLGGRFDQVSDVYQSINISKKTVRTLDSFDKFDKNYSVKIIKHPVKHFYSGCDFKSNLLLKSKQLNFYQKLFTHNINKRFQFKDNQKFNFVYSNSTYWSNNFEKHLKDLIKITNRNGYLVLQIKNNSIFNSYVQEKKYKNIFGSNFTKIIDAGRKKTWKSLKSYNEIHKIIKSIDEVEIIDISPIYGHVMPHIWNFGLRPLFEPLYLMSNNLTPIKRLMSKQLFVNIVYDMFKNYILHFNPNVNNKITQMEYTYILKKKTLFKNK